MNVTLGVKGYHIDTYIYIVVLWYCIRVTHCLYDSHDEVDS